MRPFTINSQICPQCRQLMTPLGRNTYECLTEGCEVIELHIDEFSKSVQIKMQAHWNGFNSKFAEGKCPECGEVLRRPRPINAAVCRNNGHPPLLVALA